MHVKAPVKKKIKSCIKYIDTKILKGFISKVYQKIKNEKEVSSFFLKNKKAVFLKEPVSDMFLMQVSQRENQFNQYQAYDFAIRYLAIENYYGINDYGFEFYKKMHTVGGNYGQINETEKYYEDARKRNKTPILGGVGKIEQHSVEQFTRLIESVEENGYDENTVIMADRNLLSMNGSHRSTLALYHDLDFINVEVHKELFQRRFTRNWFLANGFEMEEVAIIDDAMKRIMHKCKEKTGYFYCILFPPAEKYFDEIVFDIDKVDPDNISVVEFQDYEWEVPEFVGFLKGVYHFDSILPHNFERKLYYILRSSHIRENKVNLRIVTLNIKNPMYRLKDDNGMPESVATVRLKEVIRSRYRDKEKCFTEHYIGDYAHDVIIHSSDNFISNKAFRELLEVSKDLTTVMESICGYDYAISAVSEDKISNYFPKKFYMGEDFDIFVEKKSLDAIVKETLNACRKNFENSKFMVQEDNGLFGKQVKIMYDDFLVTEFDFLTEFPGIKGEMISKFVCNKEGREYYHLSLQDELIYRTNAFIRNSSKLYHKEYLIENKEKADLEYILNAFEDNVQGKAKKLWNDIMAL